MVINYKQIKMFISLLSPNTRSFNFLTVSEFPGTSGARPYWGDLNFAYPKLQRDNLCGSGCFVGINESHSRERTADKITRIRAILFDDDDGRELRLPLKPSITIQTSPGRYQYLFLVEGEWPTDPDGLYDHACVMEGLVRLGADPNTRDITRCARLPGTYHRKRDTNDPPMAELIDANGARYTREEIVDAFGIPIDPEPARDLAEGTEGLSERLVEALQSIPSHDRDTWVRVGMGLHWETGGSPDGYAAWCEWSKGCPDKYHEREQWRQWRSFRTNHGNPVTAASIFQLAQQHGWDDGSESSLPLPSPAPLERGLFKGGEFTQRVLAATRAQFTKWDHHPTEEQWKGLQEIAAVYEAMAYGKGIDTFYLSSLPCGIGKTTVIVKATRELLSQPELTDVGVIIFNNQLQQIETLFHEMKELGVREEQISVITSKEELNKLGNPNSQEAQIILTTQQRLEKKCDNDDRPRFASFQEYLYHGKPRAVRVWDEAILPGKTITLKYSRVTRLSDELRDARRSELATTLEKWCTEIYSAESGKLTIVPEIDLELEVFRNCFKEDKDKNTAEALHDLSGHTCRLHRDEQKGLTTLHYDDILPVDLGPLLICDASGELRHTYRLWEEFRKGIERLYSAKKSYEGLTINVANMSSGNSTQKEDASKVIEAAVEAINDIIPQNEEVLVVHFKDAKDFRKELLRRVNHNPDKIKFCSYGMHTASNAYAYIRYTIIAGILQYSEAQNEIFGRSAKGITPDDPFMKEEQKQTRLGEIKHNLFQAANRICIRRIEKDGGCPRSYMFIMMPTNKGTGLPIEHLQHIFPGATIILHENPDKLTPKEEELLKITREELGRGKTELNKASLRERVGIKSRDTFRLAIPKIIEHLKKEGIELINTHRALKVVFDSAEEKRTNCPKTHIRPLYEKSDIRGKQFNGSGPYGLPPRWRLNKPLNTPSHTLSVRRPL